MKNEVKGRGYLLLPAVIIVVSFIAVAFFINWRLEKSAKTIGEVYTSAIQRNKESFFRSRFHELIEKVNLARQVAEQELKGGKPPQLFKAVLFSDPIVSHIWYSSGTNGIEHITTEGRQSSENNTDADGKIRTPLFTAIPAEGIYNELIKSRESVKWVYGVTAIDAKTGKSFILGFNLDMRERQKYMEVADPEGQAYAFIADEDGAAVFHPDHKLIGKRVLNRQELRLVKQTAGKKILIDTVQSSFLKLPVARKYSSSIVAGKSWILVVDAPTFLVSDEINSISKYSALFGLFALIVILGTGIYSQRKWLKEFGLRQKAEREQQNLHLEKQKLLLTSEKQQKENALLQLDKLKQKINPHFLFNSLGSLSVLIAREPETAKTFVMKLSKVYRYVLNEFPDSLSPVQAEIDFAEQYTFLLRVRFGEALHVLHINIDAGHLLCRLPSMAIQTAVENAVKHNVVSKEQPLTIVVRSEGRFIVVENNLQARSTPVDSGGYGLNYIQSIYAHYKIDGFAYGREDNSYVCYFPVV